MTDPAVHQRKIIHVDMDCFYAAVEMRDNPQLHGQPIAVGGNPEGRGVVATCNYIARKFGVRSAMPAREALKKCPDIQFIRPRMQAYKDESQRIKQVFANYTDLIEPLSLDEAYLDVSMSTHCQGSATLIAEAIRQEITDVTQLSASAGVAPNKLLAKIASDIDKPNGLTVVRPQDALAFITPLSVGKLPGVGKVTQQKMSDLNLATCGDLQMVSKDELVGKFGKFGNNLYDYCRGIDNRRVASTRTRKSLSVEHTFDQDKTLDFCISHSSETLFQELVSRLKRARISNTRIASIAIKLRFTDFETITIERSKMRPNLVNYRDLLASARQRTNQRRIRLLGMVVRLHDNETGNAPIQLELNLER